MDEDFEKEKREFLAKMDWSRSILQLLNLLPDIAFFMKDAEGRFVMNNRRACEICRVASELQISGKTDYDFWDPVRADLYREGDRRVMESGEPILNEITLAPDLAGSDKLIIYSKIAVKDRQGKIIGVAGIHREVKGSGVVLASHGKLGGVVKLMHENYAGQFDFKETAKSIGMSYSHFCSRFRNLFNATPVEYLTQVRVQAACRMLEDTNDTITSIAQQTGFYDHSHFSRIFSKHMGVPPSVYRSLHAGESTS